MGVSDRRRMAFEALEPRALLTVIPVDFFLNSDLIGFGDEAVAITAAFLKSMNKLPNWTFGATGRPFGQYWRGGEDG